MLDIIWIGFFVIQTKIEWNLAFSYGMNIKICFCFIANAKRRNKTIILYANAVKY